MHGMPATFHNVVLLHNVLAFVCGSGLNHRDFYTNCIPLTYKGVRLPGSLCCVYCGLYYDHVLFYVLLTVHLSITLANDQLDAQQTQSNPNNTKLKPKLK